MKNFRFALLTLSVLSLSAFAQDDYSKYEKAVAQAQLEAASAIKSKDAQKIATAHYKLTTVHAVRPVRKGILAN